LVADLVVAAADSVMCDSDNVTIKMAGLFCRQLQNKLQNLTDESGLMLYSSFFCIF
jgi:hypothetical protein